MIALLALLGPAHAYTICTGPLVVATVPPPNAEDVPRDVRLSFLYGDACSDVSGGAEVSVYAWRDDGDGERAASGTIPTGRFDLGSLHPEPILEPLTDHTVDGAVSLAFRTGDFLAPTLTGEITGEVVAARWDRRGDVIRFEASIVPVPDPSGLSVVELADPDDPDVVLGGAIVGSRDEVLAIGLWTLPERPDTICVDAIQRDAAGRQVGEALRLCDEPTGTRGGGGCSTTGASPAWLALLSLLLLRRSR
jgi:hypothetical protein